MSASADFQWRYHWLMTHDEHLRQHFELCKRMYLRMLEDGSWPWRDSPNEDEPDKMDAS